MGTARARVLEEVWVYVLSPALSEKATEQASTGAVRFEPTCCNAAKPNRSKQKAQLMELDSLWKAKEAEDRVSVILSIEGQIWDCDAGDAERSS
jgi:hypothetical protein